MCLLSSHLGRGVRSVKCVEFHESFRWSAKWGEVEALRVLETFFVCNGVLHLGILLYFKLGKLAKCYISGFVLKTRYFTKRHQELSCFACRWTHVLWMSLKRQHLEKFCLVEIKQQGNASKRLNKWSHLGNFSLKQQLKVGHLQAVC